MVYFNLDVFWKVCNLCFYFKNVIFVVMMVGGFFDVEDSFGFFGVY